MAATRPLPLRRKIAFSFATTLLILGAVEASLRLGGHARGVALVDDPHTGYRIAPGQKTTTRRGDPVFINSLGLRDEEFPREKPEGEYRVLLLGDSVTYGVGVGQEEIFPRLLHERLQGRAGERRIRVINGAVFGYDTKQERDFLFRYGFDLQPDVVVVMFFHNDIWFNERKPAAPEFPGRSLLRRSALFRWLENLHRERVARRMGEDGTLESLREQQLRWLLDRYQGRVPYDPNASAESTHTRLAAEILREMAFRCRERGVRFAVCAIPAYHNTADPTLPHVQGALFYELKQYGLKHHYLIEALAPHHPDCWLPDDEGHLSPLGHRLVADALANWLVEQKLVPVPAGG